MDNAPPSERFRYEVTSNPTPPMNNPRVRKDLAHILREVRFLRMRLPHDVDSWSFIVVAERKAFIDKGANFDGVRQTDALCR